MSESRHEHEPVLLDAVLREMDPQAGQVVLDGTVGLGGHAMAIIPRIRPGGRFIGLDLDARMLSTARERLASSDQGVAVELIEGNYAEFPAVLERMGITAVDHILVDLGVNSAQLADPTRGFSFDREGPLDMRYDTRQERTALDLVNALSEKELSDLFYFNAQEMQSRKIAKRICQVRHGSRIKTTRALAQAVQSAVTPEGGRSKVHPATRVFQALRIAVNDELGNLEGFLEQVSAHLKPGGRLLVISFHSLEDGLVKRFLREAKKDKILVETTKRPIIAGKEERARNARSRSAKMRVAERQ